MLNYQLGSHNYMFVVCPQIEMDEKYRNQVCGLCGNFDGIANDIERDGKILYSIVEG